MTVSWDRFDPTHPDHEFVEDVADGSMCMCGLPLLNHDELVQRIRDEESA